MPFCLGGTYPQYVIDSSLKLFAKEDSSCFDDCNFRSTSAINARGFNASIGNPIFVDFDEVFLV